MYKILSLLRLPFVTVLTFLIKILSYLLEKLELPDLQRILEISGSRTATINVNGTLVPPIILESTFLKRKGGVKLTTTPTGGLKLQGKENGGRKLRDYRLKIPDNLMEEIGWEPGDKVEFVSKEDRIMINRIDGRNHPSFTNPTLDHKKRPIPPAWMVQAFIGHPDIRGFIKSGPKAIDKITTLTTKYGLPPSDIKNVLDFGCGCGRILREWRKFSHINTAGTDLHTDAMDWCKMHYPNSTFTYGKEYPPTQNADESFDLIYAISVLTHLNEDHQNQWLTEWARMTRPGGIVIATFRAKDFIERAIPVERGDIILRRLKKGNGFCYQQRTGWEGVFESFYSETYHTKEYVKREWGKHFEILELLDSGQFINRQNAAIMRKR